MLYSPPFFSEGKNHLQASLPSLHHRQYLQIKGFLQATFIRKNKRHFCRFLEPSRSPTEPWMICVDASLSSAPTRADLSASVQSQRSDLSCVSNLQLTGCKHPRIPMKIYLEHYKSVLYFFKYIYLNSVILQCELCRWCGFHCDVKSLDMPIRDPVHSFLFTFESKVQLLLISCLSTPTSWWKHQEGGIRLSILISIFTLN